MTSFIMAGESISVPTRYPLHPPTPTLEPTPPTTPRTADDEEVMVAGAKVQKRRRRRGGLRLTHRKTHVQPKRIKPTAEEERNFQVVPYDPFVDRETFNPEEQSDFEGEDDDEVECMDGMSAIL